MTLHLFFMCKNMCKVFKMFLCNLLIIRCLFGKLCVRYCGILSFFYFYLTSDIYKNYQTALEIYGNQVNFAHRTSNSVSLQQYSTPLPLAYIKI